MNTETSINHHHIILIAHRPDNRPDIVYVTNMSGKTRRYSLIDAQRRKRQLLERLAVMDEVERMLTPPLVAGNSLQQVAGSADQKSAELVNGVALP